MKQKPRKKHSLSTSPPGVFLFAAGSLQLFLFLFTKIGMHSIDTAQQYDRLLLWANYMDLFGGVLLFIAFLCLRFYRHKRRDNCTFAHKCVGLLLLIPVVYAAANGCAALLQKTLHPRVANGIVAPVLLGVLFCVLIRFSAQEKRKDRIFFAWILLGMYFTVAVLPAHPVEIARLLQPDGGSILLAVDYKDYFLPMILILFYFLLGLPSCHEKNETNQADDA